jgi:hypothetical protein
MVREVELRMDDVVDVELAEVGDILLVQMLTCISAIHSTDYTTRDARRNGAIGLG